MASEKPRILQNSRDMALSLLPLVLLCVILAGIASQCTFHPGGPKPGPVPNFDIDAAMQYDASQLPFPIRNPRLPDGWQPNSGSRGSVGGNGGGESSTVGYITPPGRYIQLTQSNAKEEALVPFVVGERAATGVQSVDGQNWVVYADDGAEPAWVADLGEVRILISGAGTTDEFETLARAVEHATPLVH